MTPQEALQMIDTAISQLNTTRAQHIQLQTAITLLSQTINPQPEDKPAGQLAPGNAAEGEKEAVADPKKK